MARIALSRRAALAMPWTSSPNSTFSRMVRCGNSAKCWNTMPNVWRRKLRSAAGAIAVTSAPRTRMVPLLGCTRRFRQRSRVLLPLPDRPMTTRISPSTTSKLTWFSPTAVPVFASTVARSSPAFSIASASASRAPNTLLTRRTSISVGRVSGARAVSRAAEPASKAKDVFGVIEAGVIGRSPNLRGDGCSRSGSCPGRPHAAGCRRRAACRRGRTASGSCRSRTRRGCRSLAGAARLGEPP